MSNEKSLELIALSQKNLVGVHPRLKEIAEIIIDNLALIDVRFGVHMGLRSWETQAALYAQGRESLYAVNARRELAGLALIPTSENLRKVTKAPAGSSWHNFGLAVDLVEDGDPLKAGIQWSWESIAAYRKLAAEAKKFPEVLSGSLFKSIVDYPHIEMHGDISLASTRLLHKSGGIPAVWDAVNEELRIAKI